MGIFTGLALTVSVAMVDSVSNVRIDLSVMQDDDGSWVVGNMNFTGLVSAEGSVLSVVGTSFANLSLGLSAGTATWRVISVNVQNSSQGASDNADDAVQEVVRAVTAILSPPAP